ncbi:hypothetical protein O3G_MSEX010737 [Manduca sexta]|uniref:Glycoside hydrolase family 20 catalytic domain-containing protein n=1 Tax=Manduca sexta TaxID=7130 RepID=A0A922CTX2_MANSE|nr:hypothetical protein O3G_MSEX010737 [Manduca sexta]
MERIVHLDLKGAPPKVPYLEKVLIQAKSWGATGILLEWEDTFPYTAALVDIGSQGGCGGDGMYTVEEVKYILWLTKVNGLEPIQLVQTIGHMEYVLKHPAYRGLREAPISPAVLCPSKPESQVLVRAMLEQALELQPDAKYFHIGADEVWHTAVCDECKFIAATHQYKAPSLYLDHVRGIASFVKQKRPGITILMWDDMLRSISLDTLKVYNLGELVQPVLWHYNPMECFQIDQSLWDHYRQLFPCVWAASAFKGANGSCQILSPVCHYVSNNEAWVQEIKRYKNDVRFAGIILTGWSRYDHYATLCELLPVSLPSLASCLSVVAKCEDETKETFVSDVLPSHQWPGEELARLIHSFVIIRERSLSFIHGDLVTTWLNPWQIEHNYTNPAQVEAIAGTAQILKLSFRFR